MSRSKLYVSITGIKLLRLDCSEERMLPTIFYEEKTSSFLLDGGPCACFFSLSFSLLLQSFDAHILSSIK